MQQDSVRKGKTKWVYRDNTTNRLIAKHVAEAMDPGTWTKEEFTVDTRFDVEEPAGVSIWDDPEI
jgi:hypothetical protein